MHCRITDPPDPNVADARVKVEIVTPTDLLICYLSPEAVGLLKGALDRAWEAIEKNPGAPVSVEYRT
jgi:hypothetical protein